VPRIFANKEGLQIIDENGVEGFQSAMPDRNPFSPITRAHSTKKVVFVTQQFESVDNNGCREEFSLENGLIEDFVQPGITRVLASGAHWRSLPGNPQNG